MRIELVKRLHQNYQINTMSKLEWNPRKKQHIDFLHMLITNLHNEIFQESFEIIQSPGEEELYTKRKELRIKIELYKKYSKRLKILEL